MFVELLFPGADHIVKYLDLPIPPTWILDLEQAASSQQRFFRRLTGRDHLMKPVQIITVYARTVAALDMSHILPIQLGLQLEIHSALAKMLLRCYVQRFRIYVFNLGHILWFGQYTGSVYCSGKCHT